MVSVTSGARRHLDDLIRFYVEEKTRPDAAVHLLDDFAEALRQIAANHHCGRPYPRPYPALAALGAQWIMVRVYWISWILVDDRPIVTNVFHASANMEGRATSSRDGVADW